MPDPMRILNLYTLKFPQGAHEAFLDPELPFLASAFDLVRIYPWDKTDEPIGDIPANVEVVYTGKRAPVKNDILERSSLVGKNLLVAAYRKKLRYNVANLGAILARKTELEEIISIQEGVVHYSYWFDQWATVLGLLSSGGVIENYVARAHNFDLYDDRNSLGYHPYRSIQLNGLAKLFPCSEMGADYLKERLPSAEIERAYLGTQDLGLGPKPNDSVLRLISVARVVSLKRIDRIVEVLKNCKVKVHWTHAGDGPELEKLQNAVLDLPSNITAEVLGGCSHDEVMELYRSAPYHALISVSTSEGLPVSMMEAMSFGVPVLSTDVGGVGEIVKQETGILIDMNMQLEDIAELLDGFIQSQLASESYRAGVRQYWQENFSAANNYPEFISELKQINSTGTIV